MKAKKAKCVFAIHQDVAYVQADYSGIPRLCLFVDAIRFGVFEGDKKAYIKLDDAIAWHEKEIRDTSGSWSDYALKQLQHAKKLIAEGKVTDVNA